MCGIVGVIGIRKAIEVAVVGAHALQHRARTYAGAVSTDGELLYRRSGKGLARNVFGAEELDHLHGLDALVHLRYPTVSDKPRLDNTQPIRGIYSGREFAVAHNGNLTNCEELAAILGEKRRMRTSLDTEYIVRLLEHVQTGHIEDDLATVFSHLRGSYSLGILFPDRLVAAVDPSGNHPLAIGRVNGGWCMASENCAFPLMHAQYHCDVEPGTMVTMTLTNGIAVRRFAEPRLRQCVFELLYNSLPASRIFGLSVHDFREKVGEELERIFPIENGADAIVTPVPDSSNPIAYGFARSGRSGRWRPVMFRNHYVGRTFVAAGQSKRDEEVARKFEFDQCTIAGKRIVVVDDSIVRGTTMPKIVKMLQELGAAEVHVRIAAPKIVQVCRYGIYMDEDETDLVARNLSTEEIRERYQATSLEYLPLERLRALLPHPEHYCFTCMGEKYW